jgi:hypothetical protein
MPKKQSCQAIALVSSYNIRKSLDDAHAALLGRDHYIPVNLIGFYVESSAGWFLGKGTGVEKP